MSWASLLCPGSPVCQDDNTSLFIWARPARFAKPASPPYQDNKKSVYMTSPLSRDEFLSTLTCTIMACSSRQGGMVCLYGKSSRLSNQDLAYNNWDLGKWARLAARINSMVNLQKIWEMPRHPARRAVPAHMNRPLINPVLFLKFCIVFYLL